MSLSQHLILHRKNEARVRFKGTMVDGKPLYENVKHASVNPLISERINRTTEGTRRESRLRIIVWNRDALTLQDQIELKGDFNAPGTIGTMYEIVEIESDLSEIGNHITYIVRRKQDQL